MIFICYILTTDLYNFRLITVGRGPEVLQLLVDLSVCGRAMKHIQILHTLAICATCNDLKTKTRAYCVLPDVCRIPTHLFEFIKFCEIEASGTGWGRSMRTGISNWYHSYENNPVRLAYLITRYKAGHGFNHRDVFRLAHIRPKSNAMHFIVSFVIRGLEESSAMLYLSNNPEIDQIKEFLVAVDKTDNNTKIDMNELKSLIVKHDLGQEHIHPNFLGSRDIWDCLLRLMPTTEMLRNLGKISSLHLLEGETFGEILVLSKLNNILEEPTIHPLNIFSAWNQYMTGHGDKGHLSWTVNKNILHALENAFFKSFGLVQPTHKKICIAVDVNFAMRVPVLGPTVKILDVAAAMAILTARMENNNQVLAFTNRITCLNIYKNDSLLEAIQSFSDIPPDGLDCALPIKWAVEEKTRFDAFIVFTSSESFSGNIHFVTALNHYRSYTKNKDVRVIVVGMTHHGSSIADPSDPLMLDIVGYDKNAPKAIQKFLLTDYQSINSKFSQAGEDFFYN